MSSYQGRPGPNVSQLINELNTSNHELDFMGDESFGDDLGDLNMFINADFTNYDMPPLPPNPFGPESLDGFESTQIAKTSQPQPTYANYNVPIQPAPPASGFPENTFSSPIQPVSPALGTSSKRKYDSMTPQNLSSEDQSRVAAEEDKRRRNTAASARFRVKKKQREQTLERTVKDISEKNTQLETKLNQLEMENKWLKSLILEKNGKPSQEEFNEAYQKFRKESEERDIKTAKAAHESDASR